MAVTKPIILVSCPHCSISIEITKVNCAIFRCGIQKFTFKQIPPHASKEECEKIRKEGNYYGCAQPFKFDKEKRTVEKCDYI
jgi:hypothetical protein